HQWESKRRKKKKKREKKKSDRIRYSATFRGETMLRSDTCFVVPKVSDARKGVESHDEGLDSSGPTEASGDQHACTTARMQGGGDDEHNIPYSAD
ncbi:hypothetical protein GBF38_014341, partial [Nibea albiflora]